MNNSLHIIVQLASGSDGIGEEVVCSLEELRLVVGFMLNATRLQQALSEQQNTFSATFDWKSRALGSTASCQSRPGSSASAASLAAVQRSLETFFGVLNERHIARVVTDATAAAALGAGLHGPGALQAQAPLSASRVATAAFLEFLLEREFWMCFLLLESTLSDLNANCFSL